MRKAIQVSQYLLLASFLFLYSCKKNLEDVQANDSSKTEMAEKVKTWIEKKKPRQV